MVGDPGLPSRDGAQATLAAVDTVLRVLPPQAVTLTLLAAGAAASPGPASPGLANPGSASPGLVNPGLANPGLEGAALEGAAPADSGRDVELYLTFGRLPPAGRAAVFPPATGSTRWRARLDVDADGAGCLEVSWRRGGPGMTGAPIDVAAVDDHPIILDSIAGWVSDPGGGIRVVATAATVDGLLAGPGRHAHVVLLDLDLGDGTTAARNVAVIRAAGPAVLVLSASDKPVSVRRGDPGRRARLCT